MPDKVELKSMLPAELETFLAAFGEKKYRAAQIFAWLYKHGAVSFAAMTNLPKELRRRLSETAAICDLPVLARRAAADEATAKYLFGLADGHAVESVLMRHSYGNSVCVSTQVGCRMGCAFCASTLGGLIRNLTPAEIADQVLAIRRLARNDDNAVHSIVIMGSGEPLDNYDNVLKFMRLMNEPLGINISFRKITLSTSGLVPEIIRLAKEDIPITLSVSLHAPNDALRDELMPVNRRYPLGELLAACREYAATTGRRVTFEYALIDGVNDGEEQARELALLLRGLLGHVNLIPLNPVRERGWQRSPAGAAERFRTILQNRGITTTIRREMGADIDAACGQLRRRYLAQPGRAGAEGERDES
ncbi:MAG: 23S rRNA (adenine(2503)-C(2))-methyltransferase RlmN [bacterium]|jgi:23S rRNA (adenine2503-C2)-methyltransferase